MLHFSSGRADAGADKDSGTCSSVSLVSGGAYGQTARPATSIATLRCEIVPIAAGASTATNSRTPSTQIKGKRSIDCDGTSQPQTLAGPSPPTPQGVQYRPGGQVPAQASVPRIRAHNIIRPELYNSRRKRPLSASKEGRERGTQSRRNDLPGV